MIPCLYEAPRLEKLPEAEERWMLETKLVRQRNRVADALGEATSLIVDTLVGFRRRTAEVGRSPTT